MWPGYCSVHQSFGELSEVNGKEIHRMGMFLKVGQWVIVRLV